MKNSTAHQLNLGGCFHASGFTLDALRTRVECLNKAIAEDPNYALGYVELADAYYPRPAFISGLRNLYSQGVAPSTPHHSVVNDPGSDSKNNSST